ncbi:SWIM zinc finger family protein [uncultured Porphyromonas sp.]|uniref:SWIM zinc finger family protein n=1 Tax=uncultured Porphyromonas sp. TaxID=159274 RepID=UPI0026220846|nr:SWIM zinc finger family protein [uncultured Porphyromonas sp.]
MKLGNRLSNKICPDDMTIEEWQVALRRETAQLSNFKVEHLDRNRIWGDYLVSGVTGRYKVAFRGVQSDRNFCSCLDFRTNGLGTCKHLEAVALYLQDHVPGYPWAGLSYAAEYTSIFVSYKGGRSIRVRIGSSHRAEFEQLFAEYFDRTGVLPRTAYYQLDEICRRAREISPSFRCYDDVQDFAREVVHYDQWQVELDSAYPDKAIPWDKQELSSRYATVEQLLYALCFQSHGFLVGDHHAFYMHLVARLVEEIYQGEEHRERGYIVVATDADMMAWQSVMLQYREYITLPVQVTTQEHFIQQQEAQLGQRATFVYIHEADCLKEWKNPLSLAVKKLEIRHLYLHVENLQHYTPVQLSSILQHINPFLIGPFYKFIHTYRPYFPLVEQEERLPEEIRPFTFFTTRLFVSAPQLPTAGDMPAPASPSPAPQLQTPEAKVSHFLRGLSQVLEDPRATELLRARLGQLLADEDPVHH